MPDIPVTSPLSYVGVFLFISGFFLLIAGLNVVRIEKVTVKPGSKTCGVGIILLVLGGVFLLPEIASPFTQDSTPTHTVTLPVSLTNTPTQAIPPTPEPQPPTDTPTIQPTDTSVSLQLMLCTRSDFDGSKCRSTRTAFPRDTQAVYATDKDSCVA